MNANPPCFGVWVGAAGFLLNFPSRAASGTYLEPPEPEAAPGRFLLAVPPQPLATGCLPRGEPALHTVVPTHYGA